MAAFDRTFQKRTVPADGCHAMARVKLETLAPVTGALRCLACGSNHVVVCKRRRFTAVPGINAPAPSQMKY